MSEKIEVIVTICGSDCGGYQTYNYNKKEWEALSENEKKDFLDNATLEIVRNHELLNVEIR